MDAVFLIKRLIRALSPPILLAAAKSIRSLVRPDRPEWEYVPEGWERAKTDARIRGWNVMTVLDAYKDKWPSFKKALEQNGPLGVGHESPIGVPITSTNFTAHNALLSYAYVLTLAARKRDTLSMLDWGGGIGHYYLISKAVLPEIVISYHCKDVPILCAYGQELFPDAIFYDDEECFEQSYDLVLASGSLQYSEDWEDALTKLGAAAKDYLYVTRLTIAHRATSFVAVQRAYRYGYDTEYLCWVLNRNEFIQRASDLGMDLRREFLTSPPWTAHGAPEPLETRGFLFRPRGIDLAAGERAVLA